MNANSYSRDQVRNIISSVMGKVDNTQSQPMRHIHDELSTLAKVIDNMHSEILATRSHDVGDKHIPSATDELDAIIGATEDASATIMDSCEAIQMIANDVENGAKAKIYDETTKIFEACSFQDITGQRISKVVKTLREIEDTVDKLLQLFGTADKEKIPEKVDTRSEDEKLLNGPQMDGEGVSQDDIDKLLAEFD
jgi:chemotaxis protein CheZ